MAAIDPREIALCRCGDELAGVRGPATHGFGAPPCSNAKIPFGIFAARVYAAPGVEAECLALQRALNIDVNLLLFCAWLGSTAQVILTKKHLNAIEARVRHWQEMAVRPLRAARQGIKTMPEIEHEAVKDLRKAVAEIELRAEQIELALLFKSARELVDGAAGGKIEDAVRRNVTALLQHALPTATAAAGGIPSAERLIAAAVVYRG